MKSIYCFIIFIILFSCNKNKTEDVDKENENIEASKEFSDTLFLGLNPYMEDYEFQSKISKYNSEGQLIENSFVLPINNVNCNFLVTKTKNSIRLKYNEDYQMDNRLFFDASKTFISSLIKIFSLKYNYSQLQIPKNISLGNYDLNKENYNLFLGDNKYVLIGYTINRKEVKVEKKDTVKIGGILADVGKYVTNKEPPIKQYDIEVEIDYYYPKDMKNILNRMFQDSLDIYQSRKKMLNDEKNKRKIIKGNLNNI